MTDESIQLWENKIHPLLEALRQHITVDDLAKFRDEARDATETPTQVLAVIDTFYHLRLVVEKL